MSEPLVSVHITTFRRAAKLERCVRSVWNQSYRCIEIVVIDDCSEDGTPAILKTLQNESPFPLRYLIHERNWGNARARNTALTLSSGTYVAFLDDDDEWIDPHKIRKQVERFRSDREDKLGIVCSRAIVMTPVAETIEPDAPSHNARHRILRRNGFILNSTVLTPRSLIDRSGGFDEKIGRGVDSDFFRSCIVRWHKSVVILPDVTARVHAEHAERMTSFHSALAVRRELHSQLHTLRKFALVFLLSPGALLYRVRRVLIALLRLFLVRRQAA